MMIFKKFLLLVICCFALSTAQGAKQQVVTDTLIKIKIVPTSQIYPKPRFIEIALKNSKFKISYSSADSSLLTTSIVTDNTDLKAVLHNLFETGFKEKAQNGLWTSNVMDGNVFYFEIITPTEVKEIRAYEPDANNYPLLHKLLTIVMSLYTEKHQDASLMR